MHPLLYRVARRGKYTILMYFMRYRMMLKLL